MKLRIYIFAYFVFIDMKMILFFSHVRYVRIYKLTIFFLICVDVILKVTFFLFYFYSFNVDELCDKILSRSLLTKS